MGHGDPKETDGSAGADTIGAPLEHAEITRSTQMDDHGDDFGQWDTEASAVQRTEDEWTTIAGHVRHAANKIGPTLPLCLPGEPQECGRSAQQHVLAWAAHLKAAAHHVIEQTAPSEARAAYVAGPLYRRKLAGLRAHTAPADVPR
ncbi:hypothetical protein [Streptomyces sp. NPDC088260]|uniref:hypothetical protein n=1 Tax=Streptomyces sp. NPDC088260 TaxID=3365850 RepID=UPI00381BABF7